jgi:WD40 repeat protein
MHFRLGRVITWVAFLAAGGFLLVAGNAFDYAADDHQHNSSPSVQTQPITHDEDSGSLANQILGEKNEKPAGLVARMHCDGAVCALAFSPDGNTLASGSTDHVLRYWDPTKGAEAKHLTGHGCCVVALSFSPDGKTLATASKDHTIRFWDVPSGRELRQIPQRDRVYTVAYSPDGKVLASGGRDETVRLWDPATGQEIRRMYGENGWVKSVAFSPDGKILASSGTDCAIHFWDPQTGKQKKVITGHQDRVDSIAFSPDGSVLASGSRDGTVQLFDVAKGTMLRRFSADPQWVHDVAFDPKSNLLASAGDGDGTRLWNPVANRMIANDGAQRVGVHAVAFSPDGTLLASGKTDGTILVRNVAAMRGEEKPKTGERLGQGAKKATTRRSGYPAQDNRDNRAETDDLAATRDALNDSYDNLTLALRSLNPSWAIAPAIGLHSATAGSFYIQTPPGPGQLPPGTAVPPAVGTNCCTDPNRGIERFNGVCRANGAACGTGRCGRGIGLPAASVACCNGRAPVVAPWMYSGTVRVVGNREPAAETRTLAPSPERSKP